MINRANIYHKTLFYDQLHYAWQKSYIFVLFVYFFRLSLRHLNDIIGEIANKNYQEVIWYITVWIDIEFMLAILLG